MHAQQTAIDAGTMDLAAEAATQDSRTTPDAALDVGALGCPMLGLKSMMALRGLKPGQTLEIATAGSRAGKALRRVAWMTGSTLTAVREEDGKFKHLLRKS